MVRINNNEKRVSNQLYPWDRWFKKRNFVLKRGVHYECEPYSMLQMCYQRAKGRGLRISVVCRNGTITVKKVGKV